MPIPASTEIEIPLMLELFRAGGNLGIEQAYNVVLRHFPSGYISRDDLAESQPGGGNRFQNIVQNSKENLKKPHVGAVESLDRNTWRLTTKGEQLLRKRMEQEFGVDKSELGVIMSGDRVLSDISRSWRPKSAVRRVQSTKRRTK